MGIDYSKTRNLNMKLHITAGLSVLVQQAAARGATSLPPSRQWTCSGGPEPNNGVEWNGVNGGEVCQPDSHSGNINFVITDWGGVSQWPGAYASNSLEAHKAVIGNSNICSANRDMVHALNDDIWTSYPSILSAGAQTFEYSASVSHPAAYLEYFITKSGWEPSGDVSFDDLEAEPFCSHSDFTMENFNEFDCEVPARDGQHVIFGIWQRSDTPEAFYSCSDVIFENVPVTDAEVTTQEATTQEATTQQATSQEATTQEVIITTSEAVETTEEPDSPWIKRCNCDGGVAAVGFFCPSHGAEKCLSCHSGYRKTGNTCTKNNCQCENGYPAVGDLCLQDGGWNCVWCEFGYILNVITHKCEKL